MQFRYPLLLLLCVFAVGCGPISQPLPPRLNDQDQKNVDAAWNQALTPLNKHDRQTWLDLLVVYHVHESGVDELDFRSSKKFTGGTVVMECHCERANPDADHFTVKVLDLQGVAVRTERYTRAEIEATARDLTQVAQNGGVAPDQAPRLQKIADILSIKKD